MGGETVEAFFELEDGGVCDAVCDDDPVTEEITEDEEPDSIELKEEDNTEDEKKAEEETPAGFFTADFAAEEACCWLAARWQEFKLITANKMIAHKKTEDNLFFMNGCPSYKLAGPCLNRPKYFCNVKKKPR